MGASMESTLVSFSAAGRSGDTFAFVTELQVMF
jgi:hypothetical protein